MGAEIFSVGSELLLGQIIDTNAAFLAQQLSRLGIDCYHKTTVGDNRPRLVAALQTSLHRSDLIVTSGGLGPTEDDLTACGVAQALGVDLVRDESCVQAIKQALAKRGITPSPSQLKQAQLPRGSRPLPNPVGTAPGFIVEHNDKTVISLPGPPVELKAVFESSVVPYLLNRFGSGEIISSRVLRLMGIGESRIEEALQDLISAQGNPTIAPLAGRAEVKVRLTAKAADEKEAERLIAPVEAEIRRRLEEYIVGADDRLIEATVSSLLVEKRLFLALAESCTGGLISHRLTEIPGASRFLTADLVCYSNEAKVDLLGISRESLSAYGAVSREVAIEMARGARRISGADMGLSTTGIAGPSGGTATKPVGLVYMAVAAQEGEVCEEHRFHGPRELIKERSANTALNLLRRVLEGRQKLVSNQDEA